MPDSLDDFLRASLENEPLSDADRRRLASWVAKIMADPNRVSSLVEQALHQGIFSEWEKESENHHFKLGSYYPTKIENCLRQQAYSYLNPETPTAQELAIFSEGHAIHELITAALRRSNIISVEGREVVADLRFSDQMRLHGRMDNLLLLRLSDREDQDFKLFVPLEIKSTSSLPDKPKQAHYYQLSTYLLSKSFPFGVLLYWAKRGGEVRTFTITKDQAMFDVLQRRVYELDNALRNGTLPRKEAALNKDYRQCEYCSYNETCNPFLIPSIPKKANLALFDIDSTLLDTSQRKRAVLQKLGLPTTLKVPDLHDRELENKFWELFNQEDLVALDTLMDQGKENVYKQLSLGRSIVGISSSRRVDTEQATLARLANLGIALNHIITREPGNFDSDTRFKTRWATRLSHNYEISEYFDRDAAATAMVMRVVQNKKEALVKSDEAQSP